MLFLTEGMMILSGLSRLFALPLFVFLTRQIVQLRMTGNYQSFFTGQLIAIILFNCCFYFQGTISPSTLLGEFRLCSDFPLPTVTNSFVPPPSSSLSLLRQPWDVSYSHSSDLTPLKSHLRPQTSHLTDLKDLTILYADMIT